MRCLNSKFLIISIKNSPRAVIGISRQLNAADAFNFFFFYLVEFLQSILIENYK